MKFNKICKEYWQYATNPECRPSPKWSGFFCGSAIVFYGPGMPFTDLGLTVKTFKVELRKKRRENQTYKNLKKQCGRKNSQEKATKTCD